MPMPNPAEQPGSLDSRYVVVHGLERDAVSAGPVSSDDMHQRMARTLEVSARSVHLAVDLGELPSWIAGSFDDREESADVAVDPSLVLEPETVREEARLRWYRCVRDG